MKRIKTKNKNTKYLRLFNKYTKNEYLSLHQITKLMKIEFKLSYNKHIMNSFIAIWSTKINKKQVITKDTFINKLFKKPDGFFRNIML